MRKSKAETAESRRQIVAAAARLFRERGPGGVSVAEVMEAAGMTHGGFYKHFASKDALLAAAVEHAFAEKLGFLGALAPRDPAKAVRHYADGYLTPEHVGDLASGCPIAGLTADTARGAPDAQEALSRGAQATLEIFGEASESDAVAIRRLSTMIGAVVLARAVTDSALRMQILAAARDDVLELQDGAKL